MAEKTLQSACKNDSVTPLDDCLWSFLIWSAGCCVRLLVNVWGTVWHLIWFPIRIFFFITEGILTCTYIRFSRIIDPQLHNLICTSGLLPLKNCCPYNVASMLLIHSHFPPTPSIFCLYHNSKHILSCCKRLIRPASLPVLAAYRNKYYVQVIKVLVSGFSEDKLPRRWWSYCSVLAFWSMGQRFNEAQVTCLELSPSPSPTDLSLTVALNTVWHPNPYVPVLQTLCP